jgi:hypothetical protein
MRTISFPAQGDYPECSLALPYSRNAAEFTIFHTPLGWRYATGTGNVFTGIAGEEKVLEIALWGAAGSQVGWAAVTDVVISDAPDEIVLQDAQDSKKAEIAAARWEAETAGIDVNGFTVRTDRESQALITGAALKAMQDSEYSCRWKGVSGFIELTAPQILAIADAVRAHVQSCFDREAELCGLIDKAKTPGDLDKIVF